MLDYDRKLTLLRDFLALGMDFHTSCLASEMTEDEEDELVDDEDFQREISRNYALLERDLLKRHDSATKTAELRGSGMTAIQWRLEKLNPNRYSSKDKGEESFTGKVVINMVSGEEGKNKVLECPECTSHNVGESTTEVFCIDCNHRIKKDEENTFIRYEVKK